MTLWHCMCYISVSPSKSHILSLCILKHLRISTELLITFNPFNNIYIDCLSILVTE